MRIPRGYEECRYCKGLHLHDVDHRCIVTCIRCHKRLERHKARTTYGGDYTDFLCPVCKQKERMQMESERYEYNDEYGDEYSYTKED